MKWLLQGRHGEDNGWNGPPECICTWVREIATTVKTLSRCRLLLFGREPQDDLGEGEWEGLAKNASSPGREKGIREDREEWLYLDSLEDKEEEKRNAARLSGFCCCSQDQQGRVLGFLEEPVSGLPWKGEARGCTPLPPLG